MRARSLGSSRGVILYHYQAGSGFISYTGTTQPMHEIFWTWGRSPANLFTSNDTFLHRLGFLYVGGQISPPPRPGEENISACVPWWFVELIPAAALALLLRKLLKKRPLEGFCPICGYDMRATPDRCPECGTAGEAPPTI